MNESADVPESAGAAQAPSAGAILRQARISQGVQIAELAAVLKVAPRKIEALEADRISELPDTAFARALARSICRQLKIDPAPVLASMPLPRGHRLEPSTAPGQRSAASLGRPPSPQAFVARPVVWGPGIIMLAALALYLVPSGTRLPSPGPSPAASAVVPEAPAPVVPPEVVPAPVPAPVAQPLPTAPPVSVPAGVAAEASLVVRSTAASWIGVVDAKGRTLIARTIRPGETVALDGTAPFNVRVGNVAATQITFRGQPVELPKSRENIARIELK